MFDLINVVRIIEGLRLPAEGDGDRDVRRAIPSSHGRVWIGPVPRVKRRTLLLLNNRFGRSWKLYKRQELTVG